MPQTISVLLIFVGAKMTLAWREIHIPTLASLGVIVACLLVGVLASIRANRRVGGDRSPT